MPPPPILFVGTGDLNSGLGGIEPSPQPLPFPRTAVLIGGYVYDYECQFEHLPKPLHRFIQHLHYSPVNQERLTLGYSSLYVLLRLVLINGCFCVFCSRKDNLTFSVSLLFQSAPTSGATAGRKHQVGSAPLREFSPWSFTPTVQ